MRLIAQFFAHTRSTERNERKKISVSGMINSFSRLCVVQMQRNSVTFDDVLKCLESSYWRVAGSEGVGNMVTQDDLLIYGGMIYETAFETVIDENGPVLRLKSEMIRNEEVFLKGVVAVMRKYVAQDGSGHQGHHLIDSFMSDSNALFKKNIFITESFSPKEYLPNEKNYIASMGAQSNSGLSAVMSGPASYDLQGDFAFSSSVNVDSPKRSANYTSSQPATSSFSAGKIDDGSDRQQGADPVGGKGLSSFEGIGSNQLFVPSSVSLPSLPSAVSSKPSHPTQNVYSSAFPSQFLSGSSVSGMKNTFVVENPYYPSSSQELLSTKFNNNSNVPVNDVAPIPLASVRSDPMNKFLAFFRNAGMDVLFPPAVHDKVSLFFVSLSFFVDLSFHSPAFHSLS
jgi:hypothetical protein